MIINNNIPEFITNINNGKVVCFKTDTIWGFSADSGNKEAIENLYKIKNRNLDKPFIFLIKKNENLENIVKNISPNAQKLINTFWPGPLTLIFEAKENLSFLTPYKNTKTIALRMPNNELCQNILQQIPYPLPSTSVNSEGQPSLNSFEDITSSFSSKDFCILNLKLDCNSSVSDNISSTIVDCTNNKIEILREGGITKKQIEEAIK